MSSEASAKYMETLQYDRQHGCVCLGGPNRYSWGWVVDDFGDLVMPHGQVTGFGRYEDSLHVH